MKDLNNNKTSINLPHYINIPFFLYQDNRLEKSAMLIAAFFYSLHTSGLEIKASSDYLCELAGIYKRQFYKVMNLLEECKYIRRSGFTNRKKVYWVYSPKSSITVIESDTSAFECTSVQELNTSALQDTKLVHSATLNLCTPVHTYTKNDNKDNKKLTTVNPNPISSSFFSDKQKEELLTYKLQTDDRSNELFLEHCTHHVESQQNDLSKYQRFTGLKHILIKQYETKEKFKATGFNNTSIKAIERTTPPTREDFNNWKTCVPGYEWVGLWRSKNEV